MTRRKPPARPTPAIPRPRSRQTIALRIDPDVLAAYRLGAQQRGIGYQTLIHEVLTQAAIDQGWL